MTCEVRPHIPRRHQEAAGKTTRSAHLIVLMRREQPSLMIAAPAGRKPLTQTG